MTQAANDENPHKVTNKTHVFAILGGMTFNTTTPDSRTPGKSLLSKMTVVNCFSLSPHKIPVELERPNNI